MQVALWAADFSDTPKHLRPCSHNTRFNALCVGPINCSTDSSQPTTHLCWNLLWSPPLCVNVWKLGQSLSFKPLKHSPVPGRVLGSYNKHLSNSFIHSFWVCSYITDTHPVKFCIVFPILGCIVCRLYLCFTRCVFLVHLLFNMCIFTGPKFPIWVNYGKGHIKEAYFLYIIQKNFIKHYFKIPFIKFL